MDNSQLLLDACIRGDEETACRLVRFLDGSGAHAVLSSLLLGAESFDEIDLQRVQASASGRLAILSFFLVKRTFSLYTLNSPHPLLKGLTPLGMAVYLNQLDFVKVLLDKGDRTVLIDGVDSHRATPIMYAARDGHLDVLQYLIRQGSRPDSVDCQYHSVLFYAGASSQCLWTCEMALRLRRAEALLSHHNRRHLKLSLKLDATEYITLASLYQRHDVYPFSDSDIELLVGKLVKATSSSDVFLVHSLLFPTRDPQTSTIPVPLLVNTPDENGWSPIHYCVTARTPNTKVLDALYLAGADLTLYTADTAFTPLHALARYGGAGASFRLYSFIIHLVRDLGAPLSAIDANGETCMHVAARHAQCADVLMAFLECDSEGTVRKIKNNNGLVAQQVAKPDFRPLFEPEDGQPRPESAASMRTVKPSFSASSLDSAYSSDSSSSNGSFELGLIQEEQFPPLIPPEKELLRSSLTNTVEAEQLLVDLEQVTEHLRRSQDNPDALETVESKIQDIRRNGSGFLESIRKLVDAEVSDLKSARDVHASLDRVIVKLEGRIRAKMESKHLKSHGSAKPFLRPVSSVPSLIASGSASSHSSFASFTSLADLTSLTTPASSPCVGPGEKRGSTFNILADADNEVDFACAIAAGSVTRRRRSSALGAIFDFDATLPPEPLTPLEEGVNLVSVPPEHVTAAMQTEMQSRRMSGKRESWLNPYVRRANTDTLKTHLANLLEIERTLFGAEDDEREILPSPSLERTEEDCISWRQGVDTLELTSIVATHSGDGGIGDSNFLDMMAEDHEQAEEQSLYERDDDDIAQYLDLYVTPSEDDASERSTLDLVSEDQPIEPSLSILEKVRNEASVFYEALNIAEKSIEHAQYYICQAERLIDKIFRDKDNAIQAARLSFALNNIHMDDDTDSLFYRPKHNRSGTPESINYTTPSSSPVISNLTFVSRFQYQERDSLRHKASLQSLISSPQVRNRTLQKSRRMSLLADASAQDDLRALHRLLVRKVPKWLESSADEVDKSSGWIGILQAVVRDVQLSL